jgi:hypothetical protein
LFIHQVPSSPLLNPHLARVQHTRQRALLRTRNRKRIHALDPYPHLGIRAVVACERGLPLFGPFVAFGLVDVVGYGEQLRVGQVVGEGLAAGGGPGGGAGLWGGVLVDGVEEGERGEHVTFHALLSGTMWSMSTSLAAVQVAPS